MSTTIDCNSDLGESFGVWRLGDDAALLPYITSANVACGFHAGDWAVMDATVAACVAAGVAIGAHPSYPDRQGFGRRHVALTPSETEQCVRYQIGALAAVCRAHGATLAHVKPHGALYNDAAADRDQARAIARAVALFSRELVLVGRAGSTAYAEAAAECGIRFAPEAFADRVYLPDGRLAPRTRPGAVLTDPAEVAAQAVRLARDGVARAIDGTMTPVRAVTICLHGDTPGAVALAAAARSALQAAGIVVAPLAVA